MLRIWRSYVNENLRLFFIYTDYKNSFIFIMIKFLNKREIYWAKNLIKFDLRIIYKKGI